MSIDENRITIITDRERLEGKPPIRSLIGFFIQINPKQDGPVIIVRDVLDEGILGKMEPIEDSDLTLFRWDDIEEIYYP